MNNFLDKRIGEILKQIEKYITPVRLSVTGWKTSTPFFSAVTLTGEGVRIIFLPCALSG